MTLLRALLAVALGTAIATGATLAPGVPAASAQTCLPPLINCPPPPPPPGQMTVRVDADPDGPTDFSFSSTNASVGSFQLDDDDTPALPSARMFSVPAGSTVTVTQAAPSDGYELDSIVCTDPTGNSSADGAAGSATFVVAGGEQVECVFNDEQPPQVRCPDGTAANESGECVINDERVVCPSGTTPNGQGQCVVDGEYTECPEGSARNDDGDCVVTDDRVQCPVGSSPNGAGQCVVERTECPPGSSRNGDGACVEDAGDEPEPPPSVPPSDPILPPDPGPQVPPAPLTVDDALPDSALIQVSRRISAPWPALQLDSGLFRDPVAGAESPGGYGPVAIGQALMREGRRAGNPAMVAAGVRAVTATAVRLTGIEENPLHLLAIASTYNWARAALAGNADFEAARPAWERYLASWKSPGVGPGAQRCFLDPECFHSYDLIDAVAVLELFATGVTPAAPDARLADPAARERAIDVLGRQAQRAVGREGRATGRGGRLHRLGILSDSPAKPLAYHALSVAALARGIELLGAEAPAEATVALKRAIDASSSFAAPDGDVAYLGRASGAIWALGATVYAAQVCARRLREVARSTALRCETLGLRALRRIVREYDFGPADASPAGGLDPYANVISSAGLTAVFLEWGAVEEARRGPNSEARGPRGEPVPLPLDRGGTFQDPAAARFAVLRAGSTWFAVHEVATSLRDPRYDFGLISLKVRQGRGRAWSDVLPPRPLPLAGAGNGSAGPVLLRGRSVGYPAGTRTTVNREAGTITVHGGWRTRSGRWLRRGVAFRYRALPDGVRLTFPVEEDDRIAIADFVPATGRPAIAGGQIRTRTFTSTLSARDASIARTSGWSSAYDANLTRVTRTLEANRARTITWTIAAR